VPRDRDGSFEPVIVKKRQRRLSDVRYRAAIIASVTPVQGHGLVWGTPKSHQPREVPIPPFLVVELRPHITNKRPDDLCFRAYGEARPLRVGTFRKAFDQAAQAIGIGIGIGIPTSSGTLLRVSPTPLERTSQSCNRCSGMPPPR
jgi:hypothetical protein